MRINLNCPFEDRAAVKALGARWDLVLKVWYVIDPPDLLPFARWLPLDAAAFLASGGAPGQPQAKPAPAKKQTGSKPRKRKPASSIFQPAQVEFAGVDTSPDEPPW